MCEDFMLVKVVMDVGVNKLISYIVYGFCYVMWWLYFLVNVR